MMGGAVALMVIVVDSPPASIEADAQIVRPTAPAGCVSTKSDQLAVPFTAAFVSPDAAVRVAEPEDGGHIAKVIELVAPGTGVIPFV